MFGNGIFLTNSSAPKKMSVMKNPEYGMRTDPTVARYLNVVYPANANDRHVMRMENAYNG